MKIVQLVPGSGNRFYCENCARDDSLIKGFRSLGHDVTVVPLYLPLRSDFRATEGDAPIFYGAASLYLHHVIGSIPHWVDRILDSKPVLSLAAGLAGSTNAGGLGDLTISMLEGEDGRQSGELAKLVGWLAGIKPDIVHLSNGLLMGMAAEIKKSLGVPLVCSLQDEHTWLDSLSKDEQAAAWKLLRRRSADIDLFLPVSRYYADFMAERIGLTEERMRVVPVGIDIEGFPGVLPQVPKKPRTIGYLSNMSHSMGFDTLADAFILLKRRTGFDDVMMFAAGGSSDHRHVRLVLRKLDRAGVRRDVHIFPSFRRADRISFLSKLSLLCVPVPESEAFGTFILEGLAAGVPAVQPRQGGFPEVIRATGGGLLYEPNTPDSLADALAAALKHPEKLAETGEAGRKAVREKYTVTHMARAMSETFESCLQEVRKQQ